MKKQLILMAALMISTAMYAQHGKHGSRGHDVGEEMKKELSLNDAQFLSIKTIESTYRDKQIALRKDSTKSKEQKLESMKVLRDEKTSEMNTVLTADQKVKWEAQRKAEIEKGKARMVAAGQKFEQKVKTDLALTDDQFKKFQSENANFRTKLGEIRKSNPDEKQRKAAFDKLKTDHDAKIKSIFSAEQFAKWTKMKNEMKDRHHDHKRQG